MSRKTSAVVDKGIGRTNDVNFLRDEATASSWLLAYGDTTTSTLKVLISAAVIYFSGTKVEFAGGYSPEMTEPTASSRIDVVSISTSATVIVTAGTEADAPTAPSVPDDDIPICEVYHKAGEVKITDEDEEAGEGYIYKDLRPFIRFGRIEAYEDVTGSRAIDTIYQNTSGNTMIVLVSVQLTNDVSDGGTATEQGMVGRDSPPTDEQSKIVSTQTSGGVATQKTLVLTMVVPNDYYYEVAETLSTGAGATLQRWAEITS